MVALVQVAQLLHPEIPVLPQQHQKVKEKRLNLSFWNYIQEQNIFKKICMYKYTFNLNVW